METEIETVASPMKPSTADKIVTRVGSGLGIACAVHCLATPIVVALVPMAGMSWFASETGELWLFGAMVATALVGGAWGVKRHGDARIIASFAAAIALLAGAHALGEATMAGRSLAVIGGLLIAGTHWLSSRLCASCADDHLKGGDVAKGHHCHGHDHKNGLDHDHH